MNGVRHYGHVAVPVIGILATLATCAMFSRTQRPRAAGGQPLSRFARAHSTGLPQGGRGAPRPGGGGAWWLGADLAPGPLASGSRPAGGSTGARLKPGPSASPGGVGVNVKRVLSHSPARAAGLAPGDVILRVNGTPVSDPADVQAVLSAPGCPKRTDLVIARNGQTFSVQVVLRERPDFGLNIAAMLIVLAAVFTLLYLTPLDRVAVAGCGAILAVLVGTGLGFYDQDDAFAAIQMSTLALLLGMGLITAALEETGFFAVVARRIGEISRGDPSRLMAFLCVTTFFLSSLVNNLTTIMVVVPVTLGLARDLRFDPAPLVIGEIISSNLGGASSMIGDFPNMLIASETGRHFHEFLLYMMPPCLVQLAVTIWFMRRMKSASREPDDAGPPAPEPGMRLEAPALAPGKSRQALVVLGAVIVAFLFCGRFAVPPATVALAGGFCMLLLWNRAAPRLFKTARSNNALCRAGPSGLRSRGRFGGVGLEAGFLTSDVLFFAGLFVLVGSVEASGVLDIVADWMVNVSGGGPLRLALVVMWGAAIVTTFLNAGPTTALFVPIVAGFGVSEPRGLLWWALSLGVCAGSSATLTGATAGPVALTKVEEFVQAMKTRTGCAPVVELSFVSYARVGVPLMLVFLLVSSAYVWGLSVWP